MKIFNWVHRKFQPKEGETKKSEFVVCEYTEKEVLLENISFGGVLTIGTFGFDPLTHFIEQKDCVDYEPKEEYKQYGDQEEEEYYSGDNASFTIDDDDDDDEDEGEVNPLLVPKALRKSSLDSHCDENNNEISVSVEINEQLGFEFGVSEYYCDKIMSKKRGERITLADLFSADSETTEKNECYGNVKKQEEDLLEKSGGHRRAKNRLSFTKKLIPQLKEDSRPMHKLQQLMKRMMKRKIHPDINEVKKNIQKEIQNILMHADDVKTQYPHGPAEESISLLQTQDVIARA